MIGSRALRALTAVIIGGWSWSAGAALEPHVAAYRLTLARSAQFGAPFTEVRGGLVIEWRLACDGWLSRQRLAFVGSLVEGGNLSHDVRFTSWEALDGSRMRYSYRAYNDSDLQDDFRGEAHLDPGDGGVASFSEPSEREVRLPPGTIFPTVHIQRVLDDARAGERFVSHQVFDGAGFDALTQITTVIGQARSVEPLAQNGDGGRGWRVSMAYYAAEEASDIPKFEAAFLLGEDGVLRDVVLDYGDFEIQATLDNVEFFDRPKC
jgi:EipB-like